MNTERIELAPEPGYGDVTWVSAYEIDPFAVAPKEKVALLAAWSARLLAHPAVSHADASSLYQVKECKFYTDGATTTATQQRVRLYPQLDGDRGHRVRVRRHAHARAAGRPGLGVPDRDRLGLPGRAGRAARAARGEAQGAVGRGRAGTTW